MKKVVINLASIQDVREFVDTVTKYDMEIDLSSGRYIVDAKSIMGIFSLDLSREVTVLYNEEEKAFEEFLKTLKK